MKDIYELYDKEKLELVIDTIALETGAKLNIMLLNCMKPIDPEINNMEELAEQQEVIMNMFINVLRRKDREISDRSVKAMKEMFGV